MGRVHGRRAQAPQQRGQPRRVACAGRVLRGGRHGRRGGRRSGVPRHRGIALGPGSALFAFRSPAFAGGPRGRDRPLRGRRERVDQVLRRFAGRQGLRFHVRRRGVRSGGRPERGRAPRRRQPRVPDPRKEDRADHARPFGGRNGGREGRTGTQPDVPEHDSPGRRHQAARRTRLHRFRRAGGRHRAHLLRRSLAHGRRPRDRAHRGVLLRSRFRRFRARGPGERTRRQGQRDRRRGAGRSRFRPVEARTRPARARGNRRPRFRRRFRRRRHRRIDRRRDGFDGDPFDRRHRDRFHGRRSRDGADDGRRGRHSRRRG